MLDRLACDEALLFSATRLHLPDPALKEGQVAMMQVPTVLGMVERPWGLEGGCAVVYKYRTHDRFHALRCFRLPLSPDMQFRYEQIGPYFARHVHTITVPFVYYNAALHVKEQGQTRAIPIIAMEWVEGQTLLEHVSQLCRQRNADALHLLSRKWQDLLSSMRRHTIAHGDLSGSNIMVRADGQLVLVDYDGVYIPSLAGRASVLLGQLDYQHPENVARPFDEYMDDFSALVISTALLALSISPALWEDYAHYDAQGNLLDNSLLFTRQDFQDPQHSPLFQNLLRTDHARLRAAVQALYRACQLPSAQVRFPADLFAGSVPSISSASRPTPSTSHKMPETERPKKPAPSLQQGLQQYSVAGIAETLAHQADSLAGLSAREGAIVARVQAFVQALRSDDDRKIAATYEDIHNFSYLGSLLFTSAQQQRALLALRRRSALARFRTALASKRPFRIAQAYNDALLDNSSSLTAEERQLLAQARALQQALCAENNEQIISAYEATCAARFVLSADETQRIQQARQYARPLHTDFRLIS